MNKFSTGSPRYSVPRTRPDLRRSWRHNDYRLDGDTAYLLLRNGAGELVGEAIIDAADLPRVHEAALWRIHYPKPHLPYVRGVMRGLTAPRGSRKPALYLHRFVLGVTEPGVMVDHRDGDGLNCRKANLRITDYSGNNRNLYGHRRVRELESEVARLRAEIERLRAS